MRAISKPGGVPLFLLGFLCLSVQLKGQDTDSTNVRHRHVTPRGAVIRSALMPGWGQWYNEQKWKAVLVLGLEAGLVTSAVYYNQLANKSDEADAVVWYKDVSSRILWGAAAVYLLNIIDAYVDANLWDFDTGPDLTVENEAGAVIVKISLHHALSKPPAHLLRR